MSNLPILTLFDESGNPIPIPAVGIVGPQGPKGDTGPTGGLDLSITGAKVGQFAEITSVDEEGKPTGWKAVPKPGGGGGTGKPLVYADVEIKEVVDQYFIPLPGIEKVHVLRVTANMESLSPPSKKPMFRLQISDMISNPSEICGNTPHTYYLNLNIFKSWTKNFRGEWREQKDFIGTILSAANISGQPLRVGNRLGYDGWPQGDGVYIVSNIPPVGTRIIVEGW